MQKDGNYESHQVIQYKRKRRARDDPMQRNYICGCGKSYLSYPALYTHIKNKHQGRAALGGQMQITRNNEMRAMMATREQPENQHEKHLTTADEALVYVLNTFKPYSNTKLLNYNFEDIFGIFPVDLRKDIQDKVKYFQQEKNIHEKISDNGIKGVAIDWIFGRFISLLFNKIDRSLLQEFCFILIIFRQHLNIHFGKTDHSGGVYTKQATGARLLQTANEFTLYYFDMLANNHRDVFKESCFINRDNRQFIGLSKFMFLFGRWAFLDRYTNSKIKINNF